MEIFVGKLVPNATVKELRQFFIGYGKSADIKINKLICKQGSLHYALVNIESDKIAQKAIRKLHRKRLNGRPVVVREFKYRAANNDRRALNWRMAVWTQLERRLLERRKQYKLVRKHEPEFSAYDDLVSKGF